MTKRLSDQRWPWLLAAGLILLVFLSRAVEIRRPGDWDSRPIGSVNDIEALSDRDDLNILFIVIDTLRAERLGSYGYARPTSPFLDQLARTGVRFDRHLAQSSWTKTSMASLWTGFYPARTGITRFNHILPEDAEMPAEILRDAGFRTAGIYRNGWVAPTFGFGQGFEVYQKSVSAYALPTGVKRENPTLSDRSTDEVAIRSALEFLRVRADGEPWFLYLHLMDLHEYVYDANSARFGSRYSDIYDNSILWTDETIRVLIESIADLGFLDKTMIVVASDHGEAFGERGFEGHARRVYRETTEVPLLVSFPFRLEPGIVVDVRTRNIDVWPTLLDIAGIEMPGTDGRSRLSDILAAGRGESSLENETAIAHLDQHWSKPELASQPTVAVVQGNLRYVRVDQDGTILEQLFDSQADPREQHNRARDRPDEMARLATLADDYLATEPEWDDVPTRELSDLELGHLRALGYSVR